MSYEVVDNEQREEFAETLRRAACYADLLAACKAVRAFGGKGETDDGTSVSFLLDEAIRKATGEGATDE